MTVKFNIVGKASPADPGGLKKFYPSIASSGRISTRELAERASKMSTLSTTDMMAALESLLDIIPDELAKGNIVELGDFGTFWLRTNSRGASTAEEVRSSHINNVLPRFSAGRQFKRALDSIVFSKN